MIRQKNNYINTTQIIDKLKAHMHKIDPSKTSSHDKKRRRRGVDGGGGGVGGGGQHVTAAA